MQQHQDTTSNQQTYAALDLGSNSFHLIVARVSHNQIQTLHKIKKRVRLAQGLDKNGFLNKETINLGLEALSQIAPSLADIPAENIRIVATYTLRAARNAYDFIEQAQQILPYPIEVISGIEEARLIYQGFAHSSSDDAKRLVIDIGGGSTELIIGKDFSTEKLTSKAMGCVSFAEQFFADGALTDQAFELAIIAAEQELEEISLDYQSIGWQACYGTSGTIKAISEAVSQAGWLDADETIKLKHLEKLKQLLLSFGHIDQIALPGVSEQRKPVLAGGLAILIAIFESFEIEALTYSDTALRDGLLYELANADKYEIKQRTVASLQAQYEVDLVQAERVNETAQQLLTMWQQQHQKANGAVLSKLLCWASQLHEVGLQINSTGFHKHSAYIIENTNLTGFNQEEQRILATLVRFQRKKLKALEVPTLSSYKSKDILILIRILRIALVLNLRRINRDIQHFKIELGSTISIHLPPEIASSDPLLLADLQAEQIAQTDVDLKFNLKS
ncbi:exopolyphosphatase [Catenovulum sp. SM1970]|uniref:Ppx/GppA phosphatase family protein n=1 Tax=Marinifaba aquimaris TaxID=2741323 RepID=UPI0015734885|nr:exopolyphosphatase [Marinifaba aquimaris]NTS77681.1 exopolyphosphatase [Marinifaba aquimaris]